jgi:hypothetical protein
MMRKCFTATDITEAFIESCGFDIHPTNAGQILKSSNIEAIAYTKEGSKVYDGKHWEYVHSELFKKALNRSSLDEDLLPPVDGKILACPEYYWNELLSQRPRDYKKSFYK